VSVADGQGGARRRPASAKPRRPPTPAVLATRSMKEHRLPITAWRRRFQAGLVGVLGLIVTGIAAVAFYDSFEASRAYAVRSGGIAPEHAWSIPLLVDSFIAVATGTDLWFTTSTAARVWWQVWWPKLLLAGAASVSFVLNIAHAERTWAARGVAAIAPAALVLAIELLMMVLRHAVALRVALDLDLAATSQALERGQEWGTDEDTDWRRRDPRIPASPSPTHQDGPRPPQHRWPTASASTSATAAGSRHRNSQPPQAARSAATRRSAAGIFQRVEVGQGERLTGSLLQVELAAQGHQVHRSTCSRILSELRAGPQRGLPAPDRTARSVGFAETAETAETETDDLRPSSGGETDSRG